MSDQRAAGENGTCRIGIVGGGISGLAAAYRLVELAGRDGRVPELHLFEAGRRLGGIIETRRRGDYLVECGPDMFITDKPWARELCERLGLGAELIAPDPRFRGSLVVRDGRVLPVPTGFQLMAPTDLWAFLRSPVLSWRGKLRVLAEPMLPARRPGSGAAAGASAEYVADESLGAFVRRRFGREALERLVQPLVAGIYTADAEQLSLAATVPRFLELEQRYGSVIRGLLREQRARRQARRAAASGKRADRPFDEQAKGLGAPQAREVVGSGARYELFLTLRTGLQRLVDVVADRLAGRVHVHLGEAARAVERSAGDAARTAEPGGQGVFRLRTTARVVGLDALILAVPAYAAAELLHEAHRDLAEQLRSIPYASSVVVVSAHREADFAHPLAAYGLVVPRVEKRPILAVSFASRKFPGRAPQGHVLLRTFLGGALQPELCGRDDDELVSITESELRTLLGWRGRREFALVVRHERAMPQYTLGHLERVAAIESLTGAVPGLALAGSAFRGVGIPDSILSGQRAAEKVWQEMTGRRGQHSAAGASIT